MLRLIPLYSCFSSFSDDFRVHIYLHIALCALKGMTTLTIAHRARPPHEALFPLTPQVARPPHEAHFTLSPQAARAPHEALFPVSPQVARPPHEAHFTLSPQAAWAPHEALFPLSPQAAQQPSRHCLRSGFERLKGFVIMSGV